MRFTLPVALLLLGAASAHAQVQTSGLPGEAAVPVQAAPSSVEASRAPTPSLPAPAPAFVLPERSASAPQLPAHAQVAAPADEAPATAVQEQRRSRLVWFLVGAVAVLAIILAVQ